MKKQWVLSLLFVLSFLISTNSHALENPEQFTMRNTNEILEILRKNDALIKNNPNAIFNLVSNKVIPLFNFTRMTQLAMGNHWRRATTEQKKALVVAFRNILIDTYREAMVGVKDYRFDIKSLKSNLVAGGKRANVSANVVYQGRVIRLGNSLVNNNGRWKIYDVSVEGISFLSNYRSSFGQIIEREGVDSLIRRLQSKNI